MELRARLTTNLRALSVTRMEQNNFDTLREEERGRVGCLKGFDNGTRGNPRTMDDERTSRLERGTWGSSFIPAGKDRT